MRTPFNGPAVEVADLVKSYGDIDAVRDVSFTVAQGEVFGFLGPARARAPRSTCSVR
jgi:ABC-type multidrug transport system ATPase subunit